MLKLLDHAKQSAKDALENISKRATAHAIAKSSEGKTTRSAPRTSAQNTSEKNPGKAEDIWFDAKIPEGRYIPLYEIYIANHSEDCWNSLFTENLYTRKFGGKLAFCAVFIYLLMIYLLFIYLYIYY